MILRPDYFNHWKTLTLAELTGDPMAPYKLLKLWGHCHTNLAFEFDNLTPEVIKAICGFEGDATKIYEILKTDCRFIDEVERDGKIWVRVHDWDKFNKTLVNAWKNGARGGRPRKQKKPGGYRNKESDKPAGYSENNAPDPDKLETSRLSTVNQPVSKESYSKTRAVMEEKREEEKRREEIKEGGGEEGAATTFFGRVLGRTRWRGQRVEKNTEQMIRIGKWFKRKPGSLWHIDEAEELASLGDVPEEELNLLEWWFLEAGSGKPGDREDERNFKRRSIFQLLKNWSKELDRATAYRERPKVADSYSDIPEV